MSAGLRRSVAALAAVVATLFVAPAPVQALTPRPASAICSGVWVVVDYGSQGGTSTRCATSFSNGSTALTSAGFPIERKSGMICRIGGRPDACTITMTAYWSYWHAKRKGDGTYGAWTYSTLGADSYHPSTGDAEGWRFGDGKSAPGLRPPQAPAPTTAPHRTATAAPTHSATRATSPARPRTASAKPTTPGTTGTVTATPTAPLTSPAPSPAAADPVVSGDGGDDTPAGVIATLAIAVAAAATLGAWRLRRGSRS